MSCKRGTAVRSSMKSLSWESGTGSPCAVFDIQSNMASQSLRLTWSVHSCKHGMKSQCHTGIKLAPVRVFTRKHPLIYIKVKLANDRRWSQDCRSQIVLWCPLLWSRTCSEDSYAPYYINTSEIPGELSRENMISSHVKITCCLHTWKDHRCYGYIINRAFCIALVFHWCFSLLL